MKTLPTLTTALLLAAAAPLFQARAQVLSEGMSGLQRVALPGNSDSIIATPFARPAAAEGAALSASGNQVTFRGAPNFTAGAFVATAQQPDSFYLLIGSGAKAGYAFPITGNTANAVTLDLDGETVADMAAGDRLSIIPYWTLGTLFPNGRAVHASPTPGDRPSEVLFPNVSAAQVNASPSRVFYFHDSHWREVGAGDAIRDHETVAPDSYLIVRHNIPTPTEWVSTGAVVRGDLVTVLGVNTVARRDNYLGLQRPHPVTLAESGLVQSGAFKASPQPGNRADELLVFNLAAPGKNKSAADVFYYWNNAWRKVGAGAASFDSAPVLTPGAGFIIRKSAATSAPLWRNTPAY